MSRSGLSRWLMALGVVAVAVSSLAHAQSRPAGEKSAETVYRVREGDTLSAIARRFRVHERGLIEANRLEDPDRLLPGQRLVIAGGDQVTAAGQPRPARPVEAPRYFVMDAPDLNGATPAFRWPVQGPISSPFGRRRSGWHAGIDIKADLGTPIVAAAAGTVSFSGWEKYYGRFVKITHDDGFVTVYAHNLQNFVKTGEAVEAEQVIGTVGRSGRASTYHLHFEIWNQGRVFNPLFFLPSRDSHVAHDGASQQKGPRSRDE